MISFCPYPKKIIHNGNLGAFFKSKKLLKSKTHIIIGDIMPKTIPSFKYVQVDIADSIIKRKDWVKYLIVRERKILEDIVASEKFAKFLTEQLDAYLGGKAVAAEIQVPIMNAADDVLSGRDPVLRAGDYIAIQNYCRSQKIL